MLQMDLRALERARTLLCQMQDAVRDHVLAVRQAQGNDELSAVAGESRADTLYVIDKAVEQLVVDWFNMNWPRKWPTHLVMEGLETMIVPHRAGRDAMLTCIVDPIDGTRGLMFDKRPAWSLAGLAPGSQEVAQVEYIQVAAMTELPTTRHWCSDQISGAQGCGLVAERLDVRAHGSARLPIVPRPSRATDFRHGFASFAKFFPEGRVLTAQLEEALWDKLLRLGSTPSPTIFDDQYISTGGQLYEVMCGHDRMVGDLRPFTLRASGISTSLSCHPYDICTEMLAREAGCVVEHPLTGRVRAPMDTTSPVCWVAYANEDLAVLMRPILAELLADLRRQGRCSPVPWG